MLGIVDRKTGTLRLFRLLVFDVIAVLLVTGLISRNLVPLRSGTAIACVVLFVMNVLVVLGAKRRAIEFPSGRDRAGKLLWLPAAVFTPAGIVAIVIWIRKPDLPSTLQAVVAILLVGYIWFLLYRVRRSKKGEAEQR